MNYATRRSSYVWLWMALAGLAGAVHAETLSLAQAEEAAAERDPILKGIREGADAKRQRAVADGQLPDPRIKLGLANFPTDTFDRNQEPMTQIQVGLVQAFPPGRTREYRGRRGESLASADEAAAADQGLKIHRAVRASWLEGFYWQRAGEVVEQSEALFDQLVNVTRARYAAGRQIQQDVIRAELERDLLRDRRLSIRTREERARADLARWVGPELVTRRFPEQLPTLPAVLGHDRIRQGLIHHPMVRAEQARVAAGDQGVAIAREAYKPAWAVEVAYGARDGFNPDGSSRADFLSAKVMMDVPLFTGKRQDRRLAASQHERNAAMESRNARLLELGRMLDQTHAEWSRLGERIARYDDTLLKQATQSAAASLNAYQSDRGDFTGLMRARVIDLDTRLQALRLRVDRAKSQAELLYLTGDAS